MKFTPENAEFDEINEKDKIKKNDRMRYIERQFETTMADWQFKLGQCFDEPIKAYAWYRNAKMVDNKIYFDGRNVKGQACFKFVQQHHRLALSQAFGKIEVILAKSGEVIESFKTIEKK